MSPSLEQRFVAIQKHLATQGVRDIKFYFDYGQESSVDELATEIADALEADMRGEFKPAATFEELFPGYS